MRDTRDILATLRQSLAPSGHGSLSGAATPFPLGAPEIDGPLGGGLARGGLHEVFAAAEGDIPASTGFALGLSARAAGSGPVVWVRQDMLDGEPGVQLLVATRPEAGIELAAAERPGLVLLDIQLPGMDGYAVLRRLRAMPELRDTPVCALSANAMREDLERARAAGFDNYLTKPIDIDALLAVVRAAARR